MRKLVTIKKVDKLIPIKGADFIEVAVIGGWSCIVKKKEFQEGQYGLFFEIDSWIPATNSRFEFLGNTKEYKGRQGWRIRTMKMRKVLSQGLLLPLSSFEKELEANQVFDSIDIQEASLLHFDFAEVLKIEKWENADAIRTSGIQAGNPKSKFPSFIPKTDQERLQNLPHYFEMHADTLFEETMKLDGSSITAFHVQEELPWYKKIVNKLTGTNIFATTKFGVCSRNLELKPSDDFSKSFKNGDKVSEYNQSDFWKTALKYNLHKKVPVGYAIQAELIGPRIQSNHEKVNNLEIHIYDIYDIVNERYLNANERAYMMARDLMGIPHVPIINTSIQIFQECTNFDIFQERVTGESINPGTISEGRVYKAIDGSFSFKLISNKYLLKEK